MLIRGSKWGYLYNTKHFILWFCNMKQFNFRHFNSNSKKFFETANFFQKEAKTAPKRSILVCLSILRSFSPFYDNSVVKVVAILDVALTCAVVSHSTKSGSRQSGGRLGGALHPHVAQCRDNFFFR